MAVLAGEDLQGLGTLCLGGTGMIAAAAHVRPDLFVAMHRARCARSNWARRSACSWRWHP